MQLTWKTVARIGLAVTIAWAVGVWVHHEAFQRGGLYLHEQLPTMLLPPAFFALCVGLFVWVRRSLVPAIPVDEAGKRRLVEDGLLDAAQVLLLLEERLLKIQRTAGAASQKAALLEAGERMIREVQSGHDAFLAAGRLLAAGRPIEPGATAKLHRERQRMAELLRIYGGAHQSGFGPRPK